MSLVRISVLVPMLGLISGISSAVFFCIGRREDVDWPLLARWVRSLCKSLIGFPLRFGELDAGAAWVRHWPMARIDLSLWLLAWDTFLSWESSGLASAGKPEVRS